MGISRRQIIGGGAAASVAGAFAVSLLRREHAPAQPSALRADPSGILDLPPGFSYRILSKAGEVMTDGVQAPPLPDGMGCFASASDEGRVVLVRNHEIEAPHGGVSRVVVDLEKFETVSTNLVAIGTDLNCAGGVFPGRGWLSCEESDKDGHGYVYLCDPEAAQLRPLDRKSAYGRFRHEAVAISPDTHVAYLTEDRPASCLYRFTPRSADNPFEGVLQAMTVPGEPRFDTAVMTTGESVEVNWVDLDEAVQPATGVRDEAFGKGAARVRRGEGIVHHDDGVYFCATTGGTLERGQIFRIEPAPRGDGNDTLRCIVASTNRAQLDMPDNLTVSPHGEVYTAEDDGREQNYIRAVTSEGDVHDIALNRASPYELAGACFSPDSRALFFNMYGDGFTVAVFREDFGPWPPLQDLVRGVSA